ncbi:hypothetical protein COCNU_16G002930 [Cocos nucifera]|uniref:Uncharacterized protein n=1 Tax=Cocos nucifera TaxID=13894 RepID=A0A8K0IY78_COCNU|nr:hypothetical protein COCNU_16G002930 [Cocos nucifera]
MSTNPQTKTILTGPTVPRELSAAVAAAEPDGVIAELGCNLSGFGALGFDGMIGNVPAGAALAFPPGEGKKGIMSGANLGGIDEIIGSIVRKAGAAEMLGTLGSRRELEWMGLVRRSVAKTVKKVVAVDAAAIV